MPKIRVVIQLYEEKLLGLEYEFEPEDKADFVQQIREFAAEVDGGDLDFYPDDEEK